MVVGKRDALNCQRQALLITRANVAVHQFLIGAPIAEGVADVIGSPLHGHGWQGLSVGSRQHTC